MADHDSGRSMRVYSRVPCPHLNTETGLCGDYENRQQHNWCVAHWDQIAGAGSDKNNTPHWCPNNDTKGALMIDATRYFEKCDGDSEKLEEFLERIDEMAINQMEDKYGPQGWAVDLRTKPTKPATEPEAEYKLSQRMRRAIKKRAK